MCVFQWYLSLSIFVTFNTFKSTHKFVQRNVLVPTDIICSSIHHQKLSLEFGLKRNRNMPRLSCREWWEAFGLLRPPCQAKMFAAQFNCNHSTIVRLNQRDDRPRPAEPLVTTQNSWEAHLRNSFQTAVNTADLRKAWAG